MEQKIINLCFYNRKAYDEVASYIMGDDFVGPSRILWDEIESFYGGDVEATRCDGDIILARIQRKYPKQVEGIARVVRDLDPNISVPNMVREVIEFKKKLTALSLSSCLIEGNEVDAKELALEWIDLHEGLLEDADKEEPQIFSNISATDLVSAVDETNLIKLYPMSLNKRIAGGMLREGSVAIFARPDDGKSLMGISMASCNCRDGHRPLYIGNEDPSRDMLMRFMTNLSGKPLLEIIKNPNAADDIARQNGYENLTFASLAPGTLSEIEGLIREVQPDVVFIDQTRNINVAGADGLVQILERAARKIRNLGKKYNCLTVQMAQAGDTAANKLVLSMSDVDNSKTGFQAAFDVMIGMGANDEFRSSNRRMLTLVKNKRPGSNHESFPVGINPSLSTVVSI